MSTHPDSHALYTLCSSSDPADAHNGFQQLGEILLAVGRARLNPARFDQTVVQDCVQEALAAIWQKLCAKKVRKPESFIPWSISIVTCKCIDRVRHAARHDMASVEVIHEDAPIQPLSMPDSAETQLPEHLVVLSDEKLWLLASLRNHPTLSHESKQVLIEGYLFEKTDDELAALLGESKANIQVIRFRNRQKLRADQAWIAQFRG